MTVPEPRQESGRQTGPACPICGKPATPDHRPFCGRRCADVDLGRWLTGQYVVPGPSVDEAGDEQDGRTDAGQGGG
jgi:endogenous inhibitor of DNA gyrase (YacG/DUF329 family)